MVLPGDGAEAAGSRPGAARSCPRRGDVRAAINGDPLFPVSEDPVLGGALLGDGGSPAAAAELSTASPTSSSSSTRARFRGLSNPGDLQRASNGQSCRSSYQAWKDQGGCWAYLRAHLALEKPHRFPTKSSKGSGIDTLSLSPSSAGIGGGRASDSSPDFCPAGVFGGAGCPGGSSTPALKFR